MTFGPTQNVTLYGGDAFLNGSIVSSGVLDVRRLTLSGSIHFHGKVLTVSSVRSAAPVAVVATNTVATIEISNTSGLDFIAAFANLDGDIAIVSCGEDSAARGVIVQESERNERDWASVAASWDSCVVVHDIGSLLDVFGGVYEVVFYNGDFFADTTALPTLISYYAGGIAVAGVVILFLTHAGELTRVGNVFVARSRDQVNPYKKYK